MKKGEVCILTCAPDYAYGGSAVGPIPANSTLEFEIELLSWNEPPSGTGIAIYGLVVLALVLGVVFAFKYVSN